MTLQCTFAPFKSKYYLNAEHPLNRKFYFFFFFARLIPLPHIFEVLSTKLSRQTQAFPQAVL